MSGLPPDAAIHRVEGREWTDVHELLATAVELLDHWGGMTAAPHYKGGLEGREPVRIHRPGQASQGTHSPADDEGANRIVTDTAEIARWFGANS